MKGPKTLCSHCRHAYSVSTSKLFSRSLWYEQFCHAYPAQKSISPVTGREIWVDDAGCQVHNEHNFCRDHNQGDCEQFAKCGPQGGD